MFPFTPPNCPRTVEIIMCRTLNCALLCSGSIFQLTACADAFATSTTAKTNPGLKTVDPLVCGARPQACRVDTSVDVLADSPPATNYCHPDRPAHPEAWAPANRSVAISPPASPRYTRTPPR